MRQIGRRLHELRRPNGAQRPVVLVRVGAAAGQANAVDVLSLSEIQERVARRTNRALACTLVTNSEKGVSPEVLIAEYR